MHIERLAAENLHALPELVTALWEDCTVEEEMKDFESSLYSEEGVCYLAKQDNEYLGFIQLSIRHEYVEGADELPVAYVEAVYVKPNYQKNGIGKMLLEAAENWAKLKGLSQIASDTSIENAAAIDFHQKAGFVEVERIVCFIKILHID